MAKNSFREFASTFEWQEEISSVAIDDKTNSGYSHTAILNKQLKAKNILPEFAKLRAKNTISYSGKSKEFRMMNPRDFSFKATKHKDIILVDDIITTGSTLSQAITTIRRYKHTPLFCLALADASAK
jgi:competence protein ComFC